MARRLDKTMADFVVAALMPALLIGMLTSLVFFLLELTYSGQHVGQMKYVLFFFIVAAVLIARIAMNADISKRAGLYGILLAIAAGLALVRFVEVPQTALGGFGWLIPISLMAMIWWSAHKLTLDSTWDDDTDVEDPAGLLDHVPDKSANESAGSEERKQHWFDRYQTDRQEEQRRKKPGTMVIYFSLAALPLFGLGQAVLPAEDLDRRREAFWLLARYMACGLGLLLTTSFLGLRRYLRGRRLQMPAAMTGLWLTLGCALILAILLLGSIVPRPEAEYTMSDLLGWAGSKERDANKTSFFNESSGRENNPGNSGRNKQGGQRGQGNQQGSQRKSGQGQNQQGQGSTRQGASGSGQQGRGQGKNNPGQTGEQAGQGNRQGEQGRSSQQANQGSGGSKQNQEGENGKQEQRGSEGRGAGSRPDQKKQQQGEQRQNQNESGEQSQSQPFPSWGEDSPPPPPPPPPDFGSSLSWEWVNWLIYVLFALAILYALWRWGKELWLTLVQVWREFLAWWGGLFALGRDAGDAPAIPDPESERPLPPFSWFTNPFLHPANFRSMEEMIRYSFAALHAWANDQNLGRDKGETPTEFALRLGEVRDQHQQEIRKLADLYAFVTYAGARAPNSSEAILKSFWGRLAV
jgi:hypothetical protein